MSRRHARLVAASVVAGFSLAPTLAFARSNDVAALLEAGDRAWARRAEGANGAVAASEPIAEAVAAYVRAVELESDRLEPRVRLLRALSFQGDYASADVAVKKEIFERGRSLFEESLQLLTRSLESPLPSEPPEAIAEAVAHLPEAGPLFYWGAVHWGQWGKLFGPLEAIRKGVAKRLRDGGEVARLLVPDYEEGAPFRLLGRMHAVAPRVPLFTGWIDHDLAIQYLEEAYRRAPDDPLTRTFLAEALLDHGPAAEHARGRELLSSAAAAEPRPDHAVEDAAAIADAAKSLATRR